MSGHIESAALALIDPSGSPADIFKKTLEGIGRQFADRQLFSQLDRYYTAPQGVEVALPDGQTIKFRNEDIAALASEALTDPLSLDELERDLKEMGTLGINTTVATLPRDGKPAKNITIISASERGKGEMKNSVWIRDQVQVVMAFADAWKSDKTTYAEHGGVARSVLLSLLDIMSTPAQIGRFQNIIDHKDDTDYVDNPHNWPHIFLNKEKNLNAEKIEGWAHKQDAWQMLIATTFSAIEDGLISVEDLAEEHKEFLALAVPFLDATQYWQRADSGSWEEIEAIRSSTLGWNIEVIDKIRGYAAKKGFEFLSKYYSGSDELIEKAGQLLNLGMEFLYERMPFESPSYDIRDPRYREADAALIYLLQLGFPQRLAAYLYPSNEAKRTEYESIFEEMLLGQIRRLSDEETNGIRRYLGDSYQGENFWTHQGQYRLAEMYAVGATGDFSGLTHFKGRNALFSQGREAAWTHPNFQLSVWAGERYRTTGEKKYLSLQQEFFLRGLAMITRHGDVCVLPSNHGLILQELSAKVPECYITLVGPDGKRYILPGPWTPLNWATGMLQMAIVGMRKTLDYNYRSVLL